MSKHRIAWLPGDGIGKEVMEAARFVLDALRLDAEYVPGDVGWELWRTASMLPKSSGWGTSANEVNWRRSIGW